MKVGIAMVAVALASCGRIAFDPVVGDIGESAIVQSGRLDWSSTTSIETVNITPVDLSRSMLTFSVAVDDAEPESVKVAGTFVDSDAIQFERANDGSPVTIAWYVTTWAGLSTRHGIIDFTDDYENTIAITPVDVTRSFVLISTVGDGVDFNDDDTTRAELVDGSTVRVLMEDAKDGQLRVAWQVIELADAVVQRGIATMSSTSTMIRVTPMPFDPTRTWLVYSHASNDDAPTDAAFRMLRGQIVGNDLVFDRGAAGGAMSISWFVIEMGGGRVVRGSQQFAITAADQTVPSTSTPGTAFPFGGGYGGTGGKTTHVIDDNPGPAWAAMLLNGTTMQLHRGNVDADADIPWSLIELR